MHRNLRRLAQAAAIVAGAACGAPTQAEPPYSGTIFIDPDIITSASPTTYTGMVHAGQGMRTMYDRRVPGFVQYNAYLFNASYSDGLAIEFQVNPEFGTVGNAQAEVAFYAPVIGRLPKALRLSVQNSWIHKGNEAFGGGNNNLLIHTGTYAQDYIATGILEEAFVHEASHTSRDAAHAASPGWLAAQEADPEFISTYARDNPTREDVAESFLVWLMVTLFPGRISPADDAAIKAAIPNRLAYFSAQGLALEPLLTVHASGFE